MCKGHCISGRLTLVFEGHGIYRFRSRRRTRRARRRRAGPRLLGPVAEVESDEGGAGDPGFGVPPEEAARLAEMTKCPGKSATRSSAGLLPSLISKPRPQSLCGWRPKPGSGPVAPQAGRLRRRVLPPLTCANATRTVLKELAGHDHALESSRGTQGI